MQTYKKIGSTFLAAALAVIGASAAHAATLSDTTLTPNSGSNTTTFFDNTLDFNETFAFGAGIASGSIIDSFRLTLDVSGAKNEKGTYQFEDWAFVVQGSVANYAEAISGDGLLSFVIDATSDTGSVNAFATSVSSGAFTLLLAERSSNSFGLPNPSITIASARLEVLGTAPSPVPLPASSLLLLAGLGGLAFMRKRKQT